MPLSLIKNIDENTILGLWSITENKQALIELLGPQLEDASRPQKISENTGLHWFASRVLLQHMFEAGKIHIHKNSYNKPTLYIGEEKYFISITHSGSYAGVIVSSKHEVGIDIEKNDERIHRVSHKFLNEGEIVFAEGKNKTLLKTLIWSSKETLYKVYGNKELDFKEHLYILPFEPKEKGSFRGLIKKNNLCLQLEIVYECFEEYVMTFGIHT